jgi:DnaJ family protein A protein 5
MDAENEKARKAARREFNDAVRELAAFLRKRDRRVAAHQARPGQGPAGLRCHKKRVVPHHALPLPFVFC